MIKWPKEMDSMLDPDIGGSMAEAIIKASERLQCKCCQRGRKGFVEKDG
jgi:hypothetical protein